ncbi:MAG TPA: sigma-70 family RNA polymerase sigma factor [Bryobacteraceae bacterium]|nr:sigma-70 family RNA polymerase sigma factor [Bryobacteraceae bacterium]
MAGTAILFSAVMNDDAKALARGLRRRDPDVLDRLIEQYQYRLFRYLLYITADRETAEDVFQETWIRVLDRGGQYDGRVKFATWLFTVARNLVIDLARRRKLESLDALRDSERMQPLDIVAAGPSPSDLLAAQQDEAAALASLARLPAIHREVLLLRFHEDLDLQEIAAVLGAPLSTVKSRLYRGLEQLRSVVAGDKA